MSQGHKNPEKILVTKKVRDFLEERRWRAIRHESGYVPGAGSFGEPGMADWQFVYYLGGKNGFSVVMWLEMKAPPTPRNKMRCNCKPAVRSADGKKQLERAHKCRMHQQADWQAAERERGALVMQVDNPEEFAAWYADYFSWLPVRPPVRTKA